MKILLINPPIPDTIANKEYYVPLGLLYLGAVLQKAGNQVVLFDGNVEKDFGYAVFEYNPDLIGFGCLFSGQFPYVMSASTRLKELSPNIPIVIGGIHPTLYASDILHNCPAIDYVVLGEGEEAMVRLVDVLQQPLRVFDAIDGFAFRCSDGVAVNPKRRFISDIDSLPLPAYNLIDIGDYYHDTTLWHNPRGLPINASLPIISSRSCPMHCNFCSMYHVMGDKRRKRVPALVVDEIERLYTTLGHRHFSFMDDNLTLDKGHTLALCNEITKRGLNIQFETPNGISPAMLDEETIDALVSAGLVRPSLAIESGSDYMRNKVMGKRLPQSQIYRVVKAMKKYGKVLYIRAFFMMGMPEETPETLDDTYRMIEEIAVDKPVVTNVVPFPQTRLFDQCLRDGLFADSLDIRTLWKYDGFYYTGNKKFFIKPYKMTIDKLQEYRTRFDILTGVVDGNRRSTALQG